MLDADDRAAPGRPRSGDAASSGWTRPAVRTAARTAERARPAAGWPARRCWPRSRRPGCPPTRAGLPPDRRAGPARACCAWVRRTAASSGSSWWTSWVTAPRDLTGEAALAELALRFMTSHGPATEADLARWSGLPLGQVRTGLAAVRDRLAAPRGRRATEHWFDPAVPDLLAAHRAQARAVHLLPGFDELVLGYADRTATVPAGRGRPDRAGRQRHVPPTLVRRGVVVGTWARTRTGVDVTPFERLPAPRRGEVGAAVRGAALTRRGCPACDARPTPSPVRIPSRPRDRDRRDPIRDRTHARDRSNVAVPVNISPCITTWDGSVLTMDNLWSSGCPATAPLREKVTHGSSASTTAHGPRGRPRRHGTRPRRLLRRHQRQLRAARAPGRAEAVAPAR